uniref:Endoplasmic reticulum junction formation protein lunapark n=1 Tax=Mola mola TaxID=94237 RepID=A0A3Q3WJ96_MOLML
MKRPHISLDSLILRVWFIRKLLIFLFSKRTERNSNYVLCVQLEEVMETETYKNAKLILERFDPEAKKKAVSAIFFALYIVCIDLSFIFPLVSVVVSLSHIALPPEPFPLSAPGGPPERSAVSASIRSGAIPRTPCTPIPGVGMHPPGPPLARPILPQNRGTVDRVIEYLVGDGPQNRYALICQQCFSHNGMALKEEFEYLAFRCAYCYFLNPARKTRPQAPRLPEFSYERTLSAESHSPGLAPHSGTDLEESAPPSGDEKELGDDEGATQEVATQPEEQQQERDEKKGEEVAQKEKEVEVEQSHSFMRVQKWTCVWTCDGSVWQCQHWP